MATDNWKNVREGFMPWQDEQAMTMSIEGAAVGTSISPGWGTLIGGIAGAWIGAFMPGEPELDLLTELSDEDLQLINETMEGRRGGMLEGTFARESRDLKRMGAGMDARGMGRTGVAASAAGERMGQTSSEISKVDASIATDRQSLIDSTLNRLNNIKMVEHGDAVRSYDQMMSNIGGAMDFAAIAAMTYQSGIKADKLNDAALLGDAPDRPSSLDNFDPDLSDVLGDFDDPYISTGNQSLPDFENFNFKYTFEHDRVGFLDKPNWFDSIIDRQGRSLRAPGR